MKASAVALAAAVISLVIKKNNPELSLLLSLCTVCVIMISSLGLLQCLKDIINTVKEIFSGKESFIMPVVKCLAISVVTRICAEICKEASQSAAAAAIELSGTVCALSVAAPLILTMLKMMGGML